MGGHSQTKRTRPRQESQPKEPPPPSSSTTTTEATWTPFLYVHQPFPDDYVPDCFLRHLVTNRRTYHPDGVSVILAMSVILQQISLVILFLLVFLYALEESLPLPVLLGVDLALLGSGYVVWTASVPNSSALAVLGWLVLFGLFLRVISPVLATLTESVSDDSIQALALFLLALHILLHADPPIDNDTPGKLRATLALNACIFATVLLASRLSQSQPPPMMGMVYGFVLLAMEIFAFYPFIRPILRQGSPAFHLTLTALLFLTSVIGLAIKHRDLLPLYLVLVMFVVVMLPLVFQRAQHLRIEIKGPWDEPKIEQLDTHSI